MSVVKHDGVVVDGVSTCAGPEPSAISRPGVERGSERMEKQSKQASKQASGHRCARLRVMRPLDVCLSGIDILLYVKRYVFVRWLIRTRAPDKHGLRCTATVCTR